MCLVECLSWREGKGGLPDRLLAVSVGYDIVRNYRCRYLWRQCDLATKRREGGRKEGE